MSIMKIINALFCKKRGAVFFIIGDPQTGWVPTKALLAVIAEIISKTAISKYFDVVVSHFGIDLAINNAVNAKVYNIDVQVKSSPIRAIYCIDYGKGADWTAITEFVKSLGGVDSPLHFVGNAERPDTIK